MNKLCLTQLPSKTKEWRTVVLGVDLNRMDRHSSKKRSNPMKKLTKAAIVFGFTLAVASSTSFAQSQYFTLTIDEFGSNNIIPFTMGPDPSGGVTNSSVLFYTVPFAVTPGDVILTEPGQPNGPNSDIVRFWNPTGANQTEIIFYSDFSATDPADAPADVGLPTQLQPLVVTIPEVGPEGNNGAIYLATPGLPGSTSLLPIQYNILSDVLPVPEPGTGALLLSGVGLLFGIKRFRRKGLSRDSSLKS